MPPAELKNWAFVGLIIIILKHSTESYLKDRSDLKSEDDFHYQFAAQAASLSRRLYKKYEMGLSELEILKTVYLVRIGKNEVISTISSAQQQVIDRLGLKLEV